jgi:hypothetical protein
MTPLEQFLKMRLVASRVGEDRQGNLIRTETRRCERTGLTLTRVAAVPLSGEYLAAVANGTPQTA